MLICAFLYRCQWCKIHNKFLEFDVQLLARSGLFEFSFYCYCSLFCYFATLQSTLAHCRRESHTNLILITVFYFHFNPKVIEILCMNWIFFVVSLTNERCLALFPLRAIVRDSHHHESLTRHKQDAPAQKLSSGFDEWSCTVVITATPRRHWKIHLRM